MPKTIKLSWQPGVGNREGRWRKFYRGKAYHFPGGKGKSDREGYDAAWAAWEIKKAEIDRMAPRKHQRDYEAAIDRWEKVLAWSNRYGDKKHADLAEMKLADLRRRFALPTLMPLAREDSFDATFDVPIVDMAWFEEFERTHWPPVENNGPPVDLRPIAHLLDLTDGSPQRIAREVWRDRLAVQDRKAAPEDESLGAHVRLFLDQKKRQAQVGELSTGRWYALGLHLGYFTDWAGKTTAVKEIDEALLVRYHQALLGKVAAKEWSKQTAWHYMNCVKSFVRWAWQINAIPSLPRVMDGNCRVLAITPAAPKITTFTIDEIKALLAPWPRPMSQKPLPPRHHD